MSSWKTWVIVVLVLAGVAFGVRQYRAAFQETTPTGYTFRRVSTPVLDKGWRGQLRQLVKAANQRTAGLSISSLQILQLAREGKEEIFWNSDVAKNVGFKPQKTVERQWSGTTDRLVGFYTLDGEPLVYTVRRAAQDERTTAVTVQLTDALAPGASVTFLRVEKRANSVRQDHQSHWVAGMNWPNRTEMGLRVRALCLPAGATIVKVLPEEPLVIGLGAQPLLGWFATDMQVKKPVAVTFDLK